MHQNEIMELSRRINGCLKAAITVVIDEFEKEGVEVDLFSAAITHSFIVASVASVQTAQDLSRADAVKYLIETLSDTYKYA